MDREKAIEYVKQAFDVWQSVFCTLDEDWGEETEALDLAIEALKESQTTHDQMDACYLAKKQAIEAIEGVDWYHVNSKGELVHGSTSDEESWYKADDIYKAIESLPPVTPTERTGEWIQNENGTYACSECQTWLPEEQYHYANYCLHCGAKMKGDTE